MEYVLLSGDSLELLKEMDDNSVDSVVTDAPYGLGKEPNAVDVMLDWVEKGYHEISGKGFMGKEWDKFVPQPILWKEVYRVLKPGGYVLSFFGTRTYDWGVMALRFAGFEIRDQIQYLYGTGFPKSLNINKSAKGQICNCTERNNQILQHGVRSVSETDLQEEVNTYKERGEILQPVMPQQSSQSGSEGSKSSIKRDENGEKSSLEGRGNDIQEKGKLQEHKIYQGSGMVNSDGQEGRLYNGTQDCDGDNVQEIIKQDRGSTSQRSQSNEQQPEESGALPNEWDSQSNGAWKTCGECGKPILPDGIGTALKPANEPIVMARKPLSESTIAANVLKWGTGAINIDASRIDFSSDADKKETTVKNQHTKFDSGARENNVFGKDEADRVDYDAAGRFPANVIIDNDAAALLDLQAKNVSRFFYVAKPSKKERNAGLAGFEQKNVSHDGRDKHIENPFQRHDNVQSNWHPTVKPITLMRYLVKMVTPPGGLCLDPFAGSGTTGCGCALENIDCILIDNDPLCIPLQEARIEYWKAEAEKN